ncbi:MAG TPA: diaminobutyrate acetyltransferase [Acidimicrobiales bacterium]|nr:diaminobutyrate acetyltransferase [Acidimicrobiales bacterium]
MLRAPKPDHNGPPALRKACSSAPRLRAPVAGDAAPMWRLAVDTGALDVNSPYAYVLVCTHFASTSLVAVDPEELKDLVGFAAAYRTPDDLDVLFVWQVGISAERRGAGLGGRLLRGLLAQPGNRGVRWLDATVTPSNRASERLFHSFAQSLGVACEPTGSYPPELFPGGNHEPEVLYRIGPLPIDGTK